MEFGPRALGNRSILGDPRSPTMQKTLNLKVKYRESFRPFAPRVLREDVAEWFELDADSPYMLLVAPVRDRHRLPMTRSRNKRCSASTSLTWLRLRIPAVTHIDYSARVQTVHANTNPRFHALISAIQAADKLRGPGQHQLQRARRADRVHSGGCIPLLHGHGDRCARSGELRPQEGRARFGSEAGLQVSLSPGLGTSRQGALCVGFSGDVAEFHAGRH